MSRATISIHGLNEFRRGLRGIQQGLPRSVRLALNSAADVLITATRPKIPRRSGRAAASLKAASTQGVARVAVGGPRAPYYPWLDFGGKTGRGKSVVRRFYKEGRYIYPTLAEQKDNIESAMLTAFTDLATSNGVEVE